VNCEEEGGLTSLPAITNPEGKQRWVAAPVEGGQLRLVMLLKYVDRSVVRAKKPKIPLGRIEIGNWNARVILDQSLTVSKEKIAHSCETRLEHEIGSGFQKAIPRSLLAAKFHETGVSVNPIVGKVGGEIVESLPLVIWRTSKSETNSGNEPLAVGTTNLRVTVLVECDKGDIGYRLSRSSKKDVEDRQGAPQLVALQVSLHVFGNEKTEAENRVKSLRKVIQSGTERRSRKARHIRERPDRLGPGKDVSARMGKELVRVEEVWTAEEIEGNR